VYLCALEYIAVEFFVADFRNLHFIPIIFRTTVVDIFKPFARRESVFVNRKASVSNRGSLF
jgi:hypothetical protein